MTCMRVNAHVQTEQDSTFRNRKDIQGRLGVREQSVMIKQNNKDQEISQKYLTPMRNYTIIIHIL